ncbi:acyl carrier protein [Streptomyces sp. NRRL B-1347]|uniref:acyl carrier protein n=1 Tax=Streptomyces sp. NRRL B-1347 TaxID=1476877 RepID=UPI0004C92C6F|nr:acyl carrier protein [Streptomyces sp. NRRL B-1347]
MSSAHGITLEDLRQVLESASGVADGVDWKDPGTADTPFGDMGYDSLAQLQMTIQLEDKYAVSIPEDAAAELRTPAALIDYVNAQLTAG